MTEHEHLLRNLLAVIFRDGGQRAATFATLAEAVEAAHEAWADLVRERDEWRERAGQRADEMEQYTRRAWDAEADAVAMREALCGKAIVIADDDEDAWECTLCYERGGTIAALSHRSECALSTTAGRDLLARIKELEQWEPSCARCGEKGPVDGIHRCKGEKP